MIVRLLASHARFAGGAVYVEPRHLEGKRADAQIFFSTDTSLLDASVIHPASPYYAISTTIASTHLGAARFRERQKHNKYDSQAKSEGASFFPFVLETYGGLGRRLSVFGQAGQIICRKLTVSCQPYHTRTPLKGGREEGSGGGSAGVM